LDGLVELSRETVQLRLEVEGEETAGLDRVGQQRVSISI
jgi:hypothetical protein